MRWGKALSGLIAVLILLNIVFLGLFYQKESVRYQLSSKREKAITTLLKNQGIEVEATLPKAFLPASSVWILPREFSSAERNQLVEKILGNAEVTITRQKSEHLYEQEGRIYSIGSKKLIFKGGTVYFEDGDFLLKKEETFSENPNKLLLLEHAEAFINKVDLKKGFKGAEVEYVQEPYGAKITYYKRYKEKPLFDSYIEMQLTEEGVFWACIHELGVVEEEENKKRIYPIDEVLMGLSSVFKEQEKSKITHIELGYVMEGAWGLHVLKEEAIPSYKILLEGLEEPVFVNAYTNKRFIQEK